MGNLNLKDDERAIANLAAGPEANLRAAIPAFGKPKAHAAAALHLACEGDGVQADNLEIGAESLPLFDTHGSRHLG